MELPITLLLLALLLFLAWLSPHLVAFLFILSLAFMGYSVGMALLSRRDDPR